MLLLLEICIRPHVTIIRSMRPHVTIIRSMRSCVTIIRSRRQYVTIIRNVRPHVSIIRAVISLAGEPIVMSTDFTPEYERRRIQSIAEQHPDLLGNEFCSTQFTQRVTRKDVGTRMLYRDSMMEGWLVASSFAHICFKISAFIYLFLFLQLLLFQVSFWQWRSD